MRRLALLLATTVLGTGCVVENDDCDLGGTLTVEWPQLQLADGSITARCDVAGVTHVDVYLNGEAVQTRFTCADKGAVITNVASGSYLLTVEAVDATGRIVLRDEVQVATDRCGDRLVQVQPSEGFVELAYSFVNDGTCITPGPSYLWFSVFDAVVGAPSVRIDESSPLGDQLLYACGDQRGIVFALPSGPYDLDWIEERQYPGFLVTGTNCNRASFSIAAGQRTVLATTLADAQTACPR